MGRKEFEDDGRTIADMSDTRQTPWNLSFTALSRRKQIRGDIDPATIKMTKREIRRFMFAAVLAGLAVALIFVGAFYLFILFCIYIWFN